MKILLVEPHPDDAVISCGGTISRLRTPENQIWSVFFIPCTDEDEKNTDHLKDHKKATKILGIDKVIRYNFPNHILENYRQQVRDVLWKIKEKFKPDLVLCPSFQDLHQDHRTIADCCLTIFRNSIILGYESIASCPQFAPDFFVKLTPLDIKYKIRAIKCYKSQLKNRPWFSIEAFEAQIRLRGVQIRTNWAEAYEFIWNGGKLPQW